MKTTIEEDTAFSESSLWKNMKDKYVNESISLWKRNTIPSFATSNAFLAKKCADFILSVMCCQGGDGRLTIIDIGAGSGRFAYMMLQIISHLVKESSLNLDWCYVIADVSEKNILYLRNNPVFIPFIESSNLDFSVVDVCATNIEFLFNNSDRRISSSNRLEGNVFYIANYLFDSLPVDVFKIASGNTFQKGNISLYEDKGEISHQFTFQNIEVTESVPGPFRDIFQFYQQMAKPSKSDQIFLAPFEACRCIQNLTSLASDKRKVLFLVTDKSKLQPLSKKSQPHIDFHGTFSLVVNMDFVARYINQLGGFTEHSDLNVTTLDIRTSIISFSESTQIQKSQRLFFNQGFNEPSPNDFLVWFSALDFRSPEYSLDYLINCFNFGYYEPDLFFKMSKTLITGFSGNSWKEHQKQRILMIISRIEHLFFPIATEKDCFYELGRVLHVLHEYDTSLELFNKSIKFFGDHFMTHYNISLDHFGNKNYQETLKALAKCIEMNPRFQKARALKSLIQNQERSS